MSIPILTKFTLPSNYRLKATEERKLCEDCGEMKLTTELRATLWKKCQECWEIYLDHIGESKEGKRNNG